VDDVEATDPALRHSDRPNRKLRWNGLRLAFSPPGNGQTVMASANAVGETPTGNGR
jgi:gentisate 1,2-dioxygenase